MYINIDEIVQQRRSTHHHHSEITTDTVDPRGETKAEIRKKEDGTRSRAAVSVAESKPHYPQTHKTQKTQKFCVLFFCVEFLSANRINNSADTQTHKKAAEEIRDEI